MEMRAEKRGEVLSDRGTERRGRRSRRLVCCLMILTASLTASGQTVVYDDGYATAIRNLRLNNLCYDVRFVDGSYSSTFPDAAPTFLNRPVLADQAANEIRDVLNAQRLVPEINASDNEVLWIPNQRVSRDTFQAAQVGHDVSSDPWRRFADFQGDVDTDFVPWDFAVFETGPQVVYADNTGYAVGIHNLNLDGECVDVRFTKGSYLDVFDEPPRYLGLEARANNATNQIMNVLNAEPNVPEINASPNEVLWIPTDRDRLEFEAEQVGHNESHQPWQRFGDFRGSVATDFAAWDFAVFEDSLDCNRDGVVDIDDMNCACGKGDRGAAILDAIGSLPGDLDGNGSVSFADFLKLSGNYGEAGGYTDGDLDCDGMIGFGDFLILSGNFGPKSTGLKDLDFSIYETQASAAAVPEPQGWMTLGMCLPGLLLVARRRRAS